MAVQASPLLFPPPTPVHSHTGFPTRFPTTVNIKSGSRETGGKIFHASWKTTFSREALSASVRTKSGGEFESPVVFFLRSLNDENVSLRARTFSPARTD